MAATCFMELGIRDINLGPNTPVTTILDAARSNQARFIWLSVSVVADRMNLAEQVQRLGRGAAEIGASVLLGGRGVHGLAATESKNVHVIHSMSELMSFARSSMARPAPVALEGSALKAGRSDRMAIGLSARTA